MVRTKWSPKKPFSNIDTKHPSYYEGKDNAHLYVLVFENGLMVPPVCHPFCLSSAGVCALGGDASSFSEEEEEKEQERALRT